MLMQHAISSLTNKKQALQTKKSTYLYYCAVFIYVKCFTDNKLQLQKLF